MTSNTQSRNPLARILLRLPVIGYASRCLSEERFGELGLLGANVAMALLLAILIWGAPVIGVVADVMAGLMLVILIAITRGG